VGVKNCMSNIMGEMLDFSATAEECSKLLIGHPSTGTALEFFPRGAEQ